MMSWSEKSSGSQIHPQVLKFRNLALLSLSKVAHSPETIHRERAHPQRRMVLGSLFKKAPSAAAPSAADKPAHTLLADKTAFPDTSPALRSSWTAVEGIGLEPVGVLFFKRIFEIAPEALQLFSFKDLPAA